MKTKYRAYPVVKHSLADQLAHVERDPAMDFDGAFAFRMTNSPFGTHSPASARCHHRSIGGTNEKISIKT